jgi:PAS domain S-box-containing protein
LNVAAEEMQGKLAAYQSMLARESKSFPSEIITSLQELNASLKEIRKSAQEIENEKRKLEALSEIGSVINSSIDLAIVLDTVMDTIIHLTGAERGFLMLRNKQGEMGIVIARNWDRTIVDASDYEVSTTIVSQVAEKGEPIITANAQVDPRFTGKESIVAHKLRSILCIPLLLKGKLLGVIYTDDRIRTGMFEQPDLSMVTAFANQAAVALDNARLYSEATRRAEEAHALITTARSISSSLDYETVLNLIVEQARTLLQADASRIHILDPDGTTLHCLVALDPLAETILPMKLKVGEGLTGYVAKTGKPLVVNDPASHPKGVLIPGTPEDDPECLAFAPLLMRRRTMGVMTVRRLGLERPFTQSEIELLDAFAVQAAVAIENAHLYGQIQSQAMRLENEVSARTQDLALSEARYRALVETSLAGIFQADVDGRIVYTNQAFANLINVSPKRLLGKELWTTIGVSEDLRSQMQDRFLKRMKGKRPPREVYEIELVSPNGRSIPCLLAESLITDIGGEPQGVTGLILDISERKALEAALGAERDRLNAILANVGDAVMVTDATSRIEYVNPAWERLNGYSSEEAISQTPRLVHSGRNPPTKYEEMWQCLNEGKTWRGELINRRKNDTTYHGAIAIQPIHDDSGKIINFVAVQHDISALKEIDRLKSQFVSDVSHELRTPLTNIRLYLDLLNQTKEQGKVGRYLQTLSRESDRLSQLIDDLLSLSRLEAGAMEYVPTAVDVNKLIVALANDRYELAARQGLELILDTYPDLPPALGDQRLFSQVFTNLLTNAMNYTQRGGIITLRTRLETEGKDRWVMTIVEDTGIGISPDELPLIFGRFFRGHASRNTGAPGTGLGLAICKEIIELSKGSIDVESKLGQGSRFMVRLPVAPSDLEQRI